MTPVIPAAAVIAAEKGRLYPAFSISGIILDPIAATVAGEDPEIAAKNIEASTFTYASPVLNLPTSTYAERTILEDKPPRCIISPASTNRGMATNGKESAAVTALFIRRVTLGVPGRYSSTIRDDIPKQRAIGAPRNTRSRKTANKVKVIISCSSHR